VPITFVAGTVKGTASDGGTTDAIDTTGADLIVVSVSYYAGFGGTPTVSDSKGNTWAGLTASTGNTAARLFYCTPAAVGSGHTFTVGGGGTFPAIAVQAFAGAHATAPYTTQESRNSSASATSVQPGSLTPSEDGCVLVTAVSTDAGGSGWSVNESFAGPQVADYAFGASMGGGSAYKIQTTAAAQNPAWAWTGGSTPCSAVMAVFKAAAGGAPPKAPPPRRTTGIPAALMAM
jgi:hypothetical protein